MQSLEDSAMRNEASDPFERTPSSSCTKQRTAPVGNGKAPDNREDDGHAENDPECSSLEYEEDAYYSHLAVTPSFDDIDETSDGEEIIVHCWRGNIADLDEIVDDGNLLVETEFLPGEASDGKSKGKLKRRSVRVVFQDLSKPYLAKISNNHNYKKFLELVKGEDATLHTSGSLSPSTESVKEFQSLSLEEQERQRAEWSAELTKIEEEIQMLRDVLMSKINTAHHLKRKLGISVWKELSDDVNQGLKNVKESQVYQNVGEKIGQFTRTVSESNLYQKTESVFKTTAEKTTNILGGFGSGISMKLGQMRNSDSFRSLEERVGSAYENVKTKVVPSRSNSTQSFDDALREAGASRRTSAAPSVTSPTIPEEKLLS